VDILEVDAIVAVVAAVVAADACPCTEPVSSPKSVVNGDKTVTGIDLAPDIDDGLVKSTEEDTAEEDVLGDVIFFSS
jgi:hypothetical protein